MKKVLKVFTKKVHISSEKKIYINNKDFYRLFKSYFDFSHEVGYYYNSLVLGKEITTDKASLMCLNKHSLDVFQQIYILLKHDSANGASSRWRALFEYSIVMLFINKYPESEKDFYLHSFIELYKYESGSKKFLETEIILMINKIILRK